MNTFPLSEPLVQRLAWTLIHFVWQGFAIALLLGLTVRLGRVRRSEWRYYLSLLALLGMIASPMATFIVANVTAPIEQPFQHPPAVTPQSSVPLSFPDESRIPTHYADTANRLDPASATQPTTTPSASAPAIYPRPNNSLRYLYSNQFTWQQAQPWIVSLWICGVALLSSRLLFGWIGVWQIRRRGISAPGWLVEQTQRLAAELRMACPELEVSHRVQEAIALGFLRPMILLPAAWVTQMPPDMLEAVLAHELAHIRRHDLWINLFQRIVETLLFYHPAVWWLSRRLRIERELCCDELVVRVTQNPLRYAETLEHIGRLSLASHSAPLIVSIMGSRSMLSVRIRNILRLPPQQQSSWAWLAGVIPLLLAGAVYWSMATGSNVSAQAEEDQADESIVSVKFSGNNFRPEADLAKYITTRPGTDVTPKQIKDDVDALIRTRWFSRVEPIISSTDEGTVLTFNVTERALIRSVEYRGNKKISTEALSKLTQLKLDQPFDISINRECVRRIQEMYKEKGFSFATVELARGDLQSDPDRDVVFLINEGPKVKITTIEFEGTRPLDATSPENKASAKNAVLLLSVGKFDPDSSDSDLESLRTYYHSRGYFDVQITPEKVFSDDKSKVEMNYRIAEGQRYRINRIAVTGNDVVSEDEIRRLMNVKPGDEYNQRHINRDIEAIRAKYGERGRLFARVHPIGKFPDEPGVVDLVYQIDEDKAYRIRDVQLSKDNDPATTSNENEAEAGRADKSQVGTRRLAFTSIDPKVPFNVRTMTARQPYRQRTELSGGVQVSVEEAKYKWQMRANQVLVETDSHDKPVTGSEDTQLHLQADRYVLTTKTPLRMTLSGNISVVCARDNNRDSAQLTADKITIDFERSLLFAEKARFKSNDTIMEGDRIAVSFRGDSFRVGTVLEEPSQPESHSVDEGNVDRVRDLQVSPVNGEGAAANDGEVQVSPLGRIEGEIVVDPHARDAGFRPDSLKLVFRSIKSMREFANLEDGSGRQPSHEGRATVSVDASGKFSVDSLAAGYLKIESSLSDRSPFALTLPAAARVQAGQTLKLVLEVTTQATCHGYVRKRGSNEPISGATVCLEQPAFSNPRNRQQRVKTDSSGRYEATLLSGPVRIRLETPVEGFSTVHAWEPPHFHAGPSLHYEVPGGLISDELPALELVPTEQRTGTLLDQAGKPASDQWEVLGYSQGIWTQFSGRAPVQAKGEFTIQFPAPYPPEVFGARRIVRGPGPQHDGPTHQLTIVSQQPLILKFDGQAWPPH